MDLRSSILVALVGIVGTPTIAILISHFRDWRSKLIARIEFAQYVPNPAIEKLLTENILSNDNREDRDFRRGVGRSNTHMRVCIFNNSQKKVANITLEYSADFFRIADGEVEKAAGKTIAVGDLQPKRDVTIDFWLAKSLPIIDLGAQISVSADELSGVRMKYVIPPYMSIRIKTAIIGFYLLIAGGAVVYYFQK